MLFKTTSESACARLIPMNNPVRGVLHKIIDSRASRYVAQYPGCHPEDLCFKGHDNFLRVSQAEIFNGKEESIDF